MTEVADAPQQILSPADLLKPPQGLIVFPEIIKSDPRWHQLPPGNIVYINAASPDVVPESVLMLDQNGNPEYQHGHIWERPITEPQRVPAVVIHTGPRTSSDSYDEIIGIARSITTKRDEIDSNGAKQHHQGYVVIIEDKIKDGDKVKEWRKLQLTNLNLVAEDGQELTIETDQHLITFGRVPIENDLPPFMKTRLDAERNAPPYAPEDPTAREKRLKEERNKALVRKFKKNGRLLPEVLPECCPDCGQNYKYIFFEDEWKRPEEHVIVNLLKQQKVCDGHIEGLVKLGRPEKIGYLGRHPY